MINLYTWPTPNGRKISILLEELQIPYKVIPINIEKDEQFSKEFSLISPNNKIPVITDLETKTNIFESGAIMLYLANKYRKYLSDKSYWPIMEWFMFQLTQVGPYLGQAHQFLYYHSGKSKFAEDNYKNYVKRLGIPDKVIEHGTQDQLYTECGYDSKAIIDASKKIIKNEFSSELIS